jgi:hypothetical protein
VGDVGEDEGVRTSWGGDDQTITIQFVANFIFHVTAFARSENHASSQIYFPHLHNKDDHKNPNSSQFGLSLL